VFRTAERAGRPILLFLATGWSEGCAAMERSTFPDEHVTALVERAFVPVRVDADLRPDIADRYGLDAWPSTLLLTADGEVLQGGTYFGPAQLVDLLERTSEMYRARRDEVDRRAAAARTTRDRQRRQPCTSLRERPAHVVRSIARSLLARADRVHGGFDSTPKFLHPDALILFLRLGDAEAAGVARQTLDALDRSALCTDAGAVYRCARGVDWSDPVREITPDTHAAALHAFGEGTSAFGGRYLERVRRLAGHARQVWVVEPGAPLTTDSAASVSAACLLAARLLDDSALGRDALALLERVCLATYSPGRGVAHFNGPDSPRLLGDQVAAIGALLDAHEASGGSQYSMLAEELGHVVLDAFHDGDLGALRDRVHDGDDVGRLAEPAYPYRTNAYAVRSLSRLGAVSGERRFTAAALEVFAALQDGWSEHGLDAAACGIAALDLIDWPDR
jgi:uncharacterized protein YyaL (SSP411 family)